MFNDYEEITEFLQEKNIQKKINQISKKYKNKKVIFYGAGVLFDVLVDKYNLSSFDIIGVSDIKFLKEGEHKGFKAIPPQEMLEHKPDVIIISVMEPEFIEDYFDDFLKPKIGKFKYEALIQESFLDLLRELKELFPFK